MMQIDPDRSLFEIVEAWPQAVDFLAEEGFAQIRDARQRELLGRQITLRQALRVRNIDIETFICRLEAKLGLEGSALAEDAVEAVRLAGLLPCPVRIPLQESLESFIEAYERERGVRVEHELQAASVGAAWLDEHLGEAARVDDLPDLFISAGFETFFDSRGVGRFRDAFFDGLPYDRFNADFDGLGLRDPGGHYAVISVVPAVFLVNVRELGDAPAPRTWEDLLDPRFERRVSLPVGDFDLFSAILLDLHRRFGDEGISALGRSLKRSLHPAQMVKIGRQPAAPAVTIMPYFFTKMTKPGSPMQPVWPEDGAIISPIFLLAKRGRRELVQPLIDHLASRELGEILAHKGLFPSTHPDVDNRLPGESTFRWLGWDYVKSRDVTSLIAHAEGIFKREGER